MSVVRKPVEIPHYTGHRQRLRTRFLEAVRKNGQNSIPDYELLEILLFSSRPRSDVKPLAKALIREFGSFAKVLSAHPDQLASVPGLSEAGIATLKVAQESALRLLSSDLKEKPVLASWKALLDYCRASMGYNPTEQFRIFFLDKKNQLIADELQQEGTVDHTPVYPREVVKRALELSASAIILVHNHPSGDPTPSKADIDMTRMIQQAASGVGISIHDHLIIGADRHYSFASHGLLQ